MKSRSPIHASEVRLCTSREVLKQSTSIRAISIGVLTDPPRSTIRDWTYLFRNGATSNGQLHGDPPADDHQRLLLQREFLQFVLKRRVAEFNEIKHQALQQASLATRYSNLPGTSEDAPRAMLHLKEIADKLREDLAAVEHQLSQTLQGSAAKSHDESEMYRRQRVADVLSKVNAIEI